jgi:hypothetical protein
VVANFTLLRIFVRPDRQALAGGRSVHETPMHTAAEVRPAMSDYENARTAIDATCAD